MSDVHNQVLRAALEAVARLLPEVDVAALIGRVGLQEHLDNDERVPWATIPAPLEPSLAYFEILTGQLETLPCLLGMAPAQVEAEISEREGHWRVTLTTPETWWMRALEALTMLGRRRALRADLGLELDMLERQHEQLRQTYAALQVEVERRERAEQERHELERLLLHQQRRSIRPWPARGS